MPIYEEEGRITREELLDLRKKNVCKECGANLNMYLDPASGKAFLACWDYLRTHHEGIEREASRYQKEGLASLNIPTRRKILEEEYGKEMTTQLEKYQGGGALTKDGAMEILKLVYPDVPEPQIIRTALLCRDFSLHPLMKEVYIIGFKNTKTGKTDYSTVLGINANRKMAADKKGAYSFLDDTPRMASHEEIVKQYGLNSEEERENLVSICRLRGEKGNEVVGFGLWPKDEEPKAKKGNTKRNMANIHSERQAMDRLPGAAIPLRHLDVVEESVGEALKGDNIIEVSGQLVDKTSGEIQETEPATPEPDPKQHWCEEHNCAFKKKTKYGKNYWSHPLPGGKWCNERKKEEAPAPAAGIKASSKCPECGVYIETLNEQDISCPNCEVVVHWQGSTPWVDKPPEAEPAPVEDPEAEIKRDPDTIKTLTDLFKACHEDFNLQPDQVIKELGVSSQSDISDTPADCYRQIAKVR